MLDGKNDTSAPGGRLRTSNLTPLSAAITILTTHKKTCKHVFSVSLDSLCAKRVQTRVISTGNSIPGAIKPLAVVHPIWAYGGEHEFDRSVHFFYIYTQIIPTYPLKTIPHEKKSL